MRLFYLTCCRFDKHPDQFSNTEKTATYNIHIITLTKDFQLQLQLQWKRFVTLAIKDKMITKE